MPSRRTIIAAGALGIAGGLTARFWPSSESSNSPTTKPVAKEFNPERTVTLGFVYIGDAADSGYNQSHSNAARDLAQLEWVQVVEQSGVAEDAGVVAVMQRMIEQDGAEFLFPTSYGYFDPYLLEFAPRHPDVRFLHTGGLALPGHPPNISSSYGYIDEAMYLCGIIAAHAVTDQPLGFVGSIPIPVVLRNINAFTLGARRINPDAEVQVRFTGSWFNPTAEKALTEQLVKNGVGALACHVDSPVTIMQLCEEHQIRAIGYHIDQSANAPTQFLTGAEWRWSGMYEKYVRRHLQREEWPTMLRGGLQDGMVALSPFSENVPAAARADVDRILKLADQGDFHIYSGPITSNKGEQMIPPDVQRRQDDPWLETMDWFVEGVNVET